jgi:hypothetical protein
MEQKLSTLIERLEAVTQKLETLKTSSGASDAAQADGPTSPALVEFDNLAQSGIKDFLDKSKVIGGLVAEQATYFEKAIQVTRQLSILYLIQFLSLHSQRNQMIKLYRI